MPWDWRPGILSEPDPDAPLTPEERELRDLVDRDRLERHVYFLASPEMKGRDNGTPESERAREYIVAELSALGVEPFFDGSWLQTIHAAGHIYRAEDLCGGEGYAYENLL